MVNRVLGFIAEGDPDKTTADCVAHIELSIFCFRIGWWHGPDRPFMPRRLPQVDIHPFSFARPRPVKSRASFWIAIFPLLVQTVAGFNTNGKVYVCRN